MTAIKVENKRNKRFIKILSVIKFAQIYRNPPIIQNEYGAIHII